MSGLKKRVEALSKLLKDDIGSEIVIRSKGQVVMKAKPDKQFDRLIRIVVNV